MKADLGLALLFSNIILIVKQKQGTEVAVKNKDIFFKHAEKIKAK